MVAKKGLFTRTWVAAMLAGAIAGPAVGAVILSDNFNDTNATAPQATDIYWFDASVTDNTTGVGGYSAGTSLGKPNLWFPMNGMYNTWIQETGGKLQMTTRDNIPNGAGIFTDVTNDLNFFDHGLQIMVRGVDFTGTSHPSYQYFRLILASKYGTPTPGNYVSIMLNGANQFSLARKESQVTDASAPEIVAGAYIPHKINAFDLRINDTRYEIIFYWDNGAIYYCGNHGLVKETTNALGAPIGWQVPTSRGQPLLFGPSSLMLYSGYRGPSNPDPNAARILVDNVTISDWVTTPTTPSMCVIPAPQ